MRSSVSLSLRVWTNCLRCFNHFPEQVKTAQVQTHRGAFACGARLQGASVFKWGKCKFRKVAVRPAGQKRRPRFKMLADFLLCYPSQRCSWAQAASSAPAPWTCRSLFPEGEPRSSCLSHPPWSNYSFTFSTWWLWLPYCLKSSWSWCPYWLWCLSSAGEAHRGSEERFYGKTTTELLKYGSLWLQHSLQNTKHNDLSSAIYINQPKSQ